MNSITRQAIIDEVNARGWSYEKLPGKGSGYIVIDSQGRRSIGYGARFLNSSANGRDICKYKHFSYAFLENIGYRVPAYLVPESADSAREFLQSHGRIAVKPVDAEQSKGVTVNVVTTERLQAALRDATEVSLTGQVVLQRQLEGKLYRLLVVDNKLFAAAYRRSAFVTGDGISTIQSLIEAKNQDSSRSDENTSPLKKIKLSTACDFLGEDGLQQVLAEGEEKEVIAIASVSAGGEAQDVTDEVHPFYKEAAENITRQLGLGIAGIDIITDDISTPEKEDGFFPIIEINSLPGFKLHLFPTAGGVARNPAGAVLDAAFPSN